MAFARTWQGPAAWTITVPAFDGNGNLVELLDVSDGDPNAVASVASYQYDPYGNLLTSAGEAAEAFPLRFSSKYSDAETGLAYFGYRYYNSGLGRWLNRDPIEEEGGTNLQTFALNRPVNLLDALGLWPWQGCCGRVTYNKITSCCCVDKVVSRRAVPTGVQVCSIGLFGHHWIKIGDWSAGFYMGHDHHYITNTFYSRGEVSIPDTPPGGQCYDQYLSPCAYDFEKLKDNIKEYAENTQQNPPIYSWPIYTCITFVQDALIEGNRGAIGCTPP